MSHQQRKNTVPLQGWKNLPSQAKKWYLYQYNYLNLVSIVTVTGSFPAIVSAVTNTGYNNAHRLQRHCASLPFVTSTHKKHLTSTHKKQTVNNGCAPVQWLSIRRHLSTGCNKARLVRQIRIVHSCFGKN